jgi:hypothetical protein
VQRISQGQYEAIARAFIANIEAPPPSRSPWSGNGEESEAHLALKMAIASDPVRWLGEGGLTLIQVEYEFPTGDRADVLLQDGNGKVIGVEIELHQDMDRCEGMYQAIKYRFMAAAHTGRCYSDSRAMLVSHFISPELMELCKRYDVEPFVIT